MPLRAASALLLLLALPAVAPAQGLEPPAPTESPPAIEPAPATEARPGLAPDLTVDLPTAAAVAGTELVLVVASAALKDYLSAEDCRWCQPPQFDIWGRDTFKWQNTQNAETASNLMQIAIPAGAMTTLWIWAAPQGKRQVAEDLVVVTEAATTTMMLTQAAKFGWARLRPYAWARGGSTSGSGRPDDVMSFWSGHTSFSFAVAAAATQVARLRGRSGWGWLAAATFAGAALTGYLRVAADQHWLTDVVTGAAVGTAVGLTLPVLVMRPAEGQRSAWSLAPAPGGLAVIF